MLRPREVVVIGAGPNGLVAGNVLADAGWDVLVLEAQDTVGGAVRSARDVADGYVHDTMSSFYPFAVASPVIQGLQLERHGLRWRHAPAVVGHPLPDGTWAVLHRDVEDTVANLEALTSGDGEAWHALYEQWQIIGPALVKALLSPFPPVRAGLGLLSKLPRVGGLTYVRELVTPVVDLVEQMFHGEAARLLLTGNALHADAPLAGPLSGMFGTLLSMLGQTAGFPVPEGGAQSLSDALARRLTAQTGRIRTGARVTGIGTDRRRVRWVEVCGGERIATRVVVADVAAPALYGGLIPVEELPQRVRRGMRLFQLDPGTIKVDWALSGRVPWNNPPTRAPGTVHIADSVDALILAQAQIVAHQVPARPFLLTGQMTSADPTRSPSGTEAFWAYTQVPQDVRGDAGQDGLTGVWDVDEKERMADRMQAEIEVHAADFASRIIARRILGPDDLEARDENLIGGARVGGTAGLHQQLVFRPIPGLGRAGTSIHGLFLASASAHPGGAVHGAPGANAARAVLAAARTGRL
jgi:phytoene dehydrogenase-like protein